jgi:hypothetical protein
MSATTWLTTSFGSPPTAPGGLPTPGSTPSWLSAILKKNNSGLMYFGLPCRMEGQRARSMIAAVAE